MGKRAGQWSALVVADLIVYPYREEKSLPGLRPHEWLALGALTISDSLIGPSAAIQGEA